MHFYTDTDRLCACVQALFARIGQEEPSAANAILASHLVIRLRCTDPDAEITMNGRQRAVQTTFGPCRMRPTLDIELTASTLHRILLGELSLTKALADGLLKVYGPVWKTMALADLFHRGQVLYPQMLREQGLLD